MSQEFPYFDSADSPFSVERFAKNAADVLRIQTSLQERQVEALEKLADSVFRYVELAAMQGPKQ